MPTIHEHVAGARRRLREAGIAQDEADLDARVLAEHLLNWDAARYFTDGASQAPASFLAHYDRAIARRLQREPLAYITGTQEFWGRAFDVTPAVLIPRPETELIIEIVLETWPDRLVPLRIADACSGSGCLAVTIACEYPKAMLTTTDISPAALQVARTNAARHSISDRISLVETDVLSGVTGPFDAIVSNPPYVPEDELATLQPEVGQYEPRLALAAGRDGLDLVRRLIDQSATLLAPGGWLVFEFGFGQSAGVTRLIARPGLQMVALRQDLQGIPRTAVARRAID